MEWVPEKETPRYVPPEVRRKVKQRGLLKFIVAVAEMGIGVALYSLLGTLALPRTLSGLENSPDGVRTTGTVMRGELRKDISFNGVHPYEIEYRFVDKNGVQRKGEIWVWEKTRFAHLDAGDIVDVVYHRKAPDVNKIFGAEPVGLPWWVPYLALTVSLLIGVPLLFFGSRGVAREIALLEYGALAEGRVVSVKILHYVNLGWNNHPVRVMVSFKDEFGEERSITAKTTTRNLTLKEKDRCRVLYDRGEPQRAVVVETLSTA